MLFCWLKYFSMGRLSFHMISGNMFLLSCFVLSGEDFSLQQNKVE